jgi:glycosyltransferase involved in cell wall biosynthesis
MNRYNEIMKKIRILFIIPFMNGGGAERVVLSLLKHLNREKFEPILVMMKREGRYLHLIPHDIEVIDLKASQARFSVFKIMRVIKEKQPDIVFATLAYLNLIIAMIRPFFSKNITFIARESNTVSVRNKREKYPRLFDFLYKSIYKNFDKIITQAAFMRDDLVENYGIDSQKMTIIYNPVDVKAVKEKAKEPLAKPLPNAYNLLAVGKLGYQKGYDILLPIIAKLDDSYHLTILGEGGDKAQLKAQCKELGIEHRVDFAGFSDNPFAYMARADLLLLSSRYEGLANVVLEANVLGKGVVAFDAPGGVGEIVKEGINGFLVPSFDSEAFLNSIKKARSYSFNAQAISTMTAQRFGVERIIQYYEKEFLACKGV